jgi:hypothetical protein
MRTEEYIEGYIYARRLGHRIRIKRKIESYMVTV